MFISIRSILFPTDFSDTAKEAQQYAMALADRFGAELHLLHVVPLVMPYADVSTSWAMPDVDMQPQVEAAEKRLALELGPQWAEERRTVHTVVVGYVVEEIVKYSKDRNIDMIVIGTHGRTKLSHLLLGSVAEKLVRLATCPVLSVHPKGHPFAIDVTAEPPAPSRS